jgi:hypothetical protein
MAQVSGRLGSAEYAELVTRIHEAVRSNLAPGASLLVLSKGDAGLVEIPGFSAAHFPQDASGAYAGHHPRDSAAAIAALEQLSRRGAQYLVIPTTALWWLDFYTELAEHLGTHGELIADVEGACLIFDLGRRPANAQLAPVAQLPRASAAELRDYLQRLLSSDSRVVVVETGEELALELAPLQAVPISAQELREHREQALDALTRLAARGAEYLIVSRAAQEWLRRDPGAAAEVDARCRKIAEQGHLCRVYELSGLWASS